LQRESDTVAKVILGLSKTLASTLNLDEVLLRILDSVGLVIPLDSCSILLRRDDDLEIVAAAGFDRDDEVIGLRYSLDGHPLNRFVIDSGTPMLLEDASADPRWSQRENATPIRGWMGLPLCVSGEVIGMLAIDSHERGLYTAEEQALAGALADLAAVAVRNAMLYAQARRKAAEAAALADAGREISESLDPDVVLRRIAMRAQALLSRDSAAVFLLEPDGALRAVVAVGRQAASLQGFRFAPSTGIVGRVAAAGKALIVNDVASDRDSVTAPGVDDAPGQKLLAAPLVVGGKVAGVMAVLRGAGEKEFDGADLDFLAALARQAAVALENANLHRRVKDAAARSAALYEAASAARIAAEEANATKSRFLANMTHELRTPLNSIINLAYLIQEDEDEPAPAIRDSASRIEGAGRHLLGLINDVLDLAKVEAGRMEVRPEESDFRQIARAVLSAASGLELRPGVELRDEIPEGLPPVLADRTRLRQVLFNLIANAVKFTESGYIALRAQPEESWLLVEVEDTGIGMDESELPKAFAEFVQLDDDLDRRAGGSGLGLPLSRHLVELQGGKLWAESRKGFGSTFRFTLPLASKISSDALGRKDVQQ
jgi:Osmosensitive K+ channel histidine kinase